MEWAILVLLLGLVAVVPGLLYRPPALFVVRLRRGAAEAVRGTVTSAFLAAVEETAARSGVQDGEVRGVRRGRLITLSFSRGVPRDFQQRLRNWWGLSGWAARPGRP